MNDHTILGCTLLILHTIIQKTHATILLTDDIALRALLTTAATEHAHGQFAMQEYKQKLDPIKIEFATQSQIKQALDLWFVD